MTSSTEGSSCILLVDDEPSILSAVRRELSVPQAGRPRYRIEAFTNPLEALERAREQAFDLVLSDYRMPEMDGLAFLMAFAELQPDCIRMVLSGQTDLQALIRMINETSIYRFIPKPWSSYYLKSSIKQGLELRETNVNNRRLAKSLLSAGFVLPEGAIDPVDRVLVVDDDRAVANTIAYCLTMRPRLDHALRESREEKQDSARFRGKNIEVHIACSAQEALRMADELVFSCVIADFRMPDMDGACFLAAFSEKQPDCPSILMSGTVNMEGVVIALDLARLYAFVAKPWDDFQLRTLVTQAVIQHRLILENRLLSQLCKTHKLDAVGSTAFEKDGE